MAKQSSVYGHRSFLTGLKPGIDLQRHK